MSDDNKLTRPEIYQLVNGYIEVHGGYLGNFSYRTHAEFYPYFCDLDIDPAQYEGTTRERFLRILENASPIDQAKILKGIFDKYPVSYFPEEVRERKQQLLEEFTWIIERLDPKHIERKGVSGDVKNLIFATTGPKPDIVLSDSLSNKVRIIKNGEFCLAYERPISDTGLLWVDLVKWWSETKSLPFPDRETENSLYRRLKSSLSSPPEKLLFESYFKALYHKMGNQFPALCPQVYLYYDPKTLRERRGEKPLPQQRMDFLLLLSNRDRVVIEVDGQQHYSENGKPSPQVYATTVATDRQLRLDGYQVFRFGGYELEGVRGQELIQDFFQRLFRSYALY